MRQGMDSNARRHLDGLHRMAAFYALPQGRAGVLDQVDESLAERIEQVEDIQRQETPGAIDRDLVALGFFQGMQRRIPPTHQVNKTVAVASGRHPAAQAVRPVEPGFMDAQAQLPKKLPLAVHEGIAQDTAMARIVDHDRV